MRRDEILRVRLTEAERKALERLAQKRFVTVSTLVRSTVLTEAQKEGVLTEEATGNGGER